jgi:hypothetical protein
LNLTLGQIGDEGKKEQVAMAATHAIIYLTAG